jgi:drug/metabolite transporter (DMT)-like permease
MRWISTADWSDNLRAIAWLMVSSVVFVGLELVAKQLIAEDGMSPFQVLWIRAVLTAIAIPIILRRSPIAVVKTRHPGKQIWRSVLLATASIAFFSSIAVVPLADAVAIVFVSPLFLTAIAFFFLKEVVGWRRWSGCLVGFVGVLLIVQPGMGERHWMYLLPLIDAAFSAVYVILTRMVGKDDGAWTCLFYSVAASAVLFTVPLPFVWVNPTMMQWVLLLAASGFGLVAHFCHIRAYSLGESSLLAPLSYIHIVFTTGAAFAVFGTFPDPLAAGGIVMIVGAGLYILHRETVRRGRPRPVATPGVD